MKFLLYSACSAAWSCWPRVIGAVRRVGPGGAARDFAHQHAHRAGHRPATRRAAGCSSGFFFAFAIKAPLWPVHTWLPDAAAEAPPGTAVLLVGVLDKVGTFGMIALLPAAVPRGLAVGHAGGASRWRVVVDPLRRAAGDRPDRHEAADRLHLDVATSASSCWASSR